jgi:hypothetical protein
MEYLGGGGPTWNLAGDVGKYNKAYFSAAALPGRMMSGLGLAILPRYESLRRTMGFFRYSHEL